MEHNYKTFEEVEKYIKTLDHVEKGQSVFGGMGTYSLQTDFFTDGEIFVEFERERDTRKTLDKDNVFPTDDCITYSLYLVEKTHGKIVEWIRKETLWTMERRYNEKKVK